MNAFKTADQWKNFNKIIGDFIDQSAIEEISVDEFDSSLPVDVYNMNGVKVAQSLENLPEGIYIVRQGNKSAKIRKESILSKDLNTHYRRVCQNSSSVSVPLLR